MAWINLRSEIADMFAELVTFVPDASSFRFFRLERPADVVARVARWRAQNRERRNATVRAAYHRDPELAREKARAWRAKNVERMREIRRASAARKRATR